MTTVLIMAVTISAISHQSEGAFGWSGGFLFCLVDGSFIQVPLQTLQKLNSKSSPQLGKNKYHKLTFASSHQYPKMKEDTHSDEYDSKSSLAHIRNILKAISSKNHITKKQAGYCQLLASMIFFDIRYLKSSNASKRMVLVIMDLRWDDTSIDAVEFPIG